MSTNATEAAAPPKKRRNGLVGLIAAIAGAISGLGSTYAARAAAPSEIAELRKDIASVLERLRTVELAQAREEGAAAERLRRSR